MSVTRTAHRSTLVLLLALATFAWAAMLSTSSLLGPATATASAQEDGAEQLAPEDEEGTDDPDADADGDDVSGALQLDDEDGEDGDATGEGELDGEGDLEGDDLGDDDFGDESFEDDGDATPVGGVDAGFGGMAADGGADNGLLIATAFLLLVLALGAWTVQARRTAELSA